MNMPVPMVELWRSSLLESSHTGHAVICNDKGEVVESWGNPDELIYPRSSCKMVQALPLITSGAAARYGLTSEQLALACASHNGAAIHTQRVANWLETIGLAEPDLRCGPQDPDDRTAHEQLIRNNERPCQIHNNCSGKHAGFLSLAGHLGAGPEYVEIDHPVQMASREAFERAIDGTSPTYGLDGCSAPNFATPLKGLARAMAWFASASDRSDRDSEAAQSLFQAMIAHPELVAGEERACTVLMRAMEGGVAIKTGAEGVFVAIVPEKRLGVALKITDGTTRASECAIAAILVHLGVLDRGHPSALRYIDASLTNRRGLKVGRQRPAKSFIANA